MGGRPFRVLIFGRDPDALIALQQVFENAGLDTTITWGEGETRKLARTLNFDIILLRDCPPGLLAESVQHELRNQRGQLIVVTENRSEAEYFQRLGFRVIDKREPLGVLEQLRPYTYSAAA